MRKSKFTDQADHLCRTPSRGRHPAGAPRIDVVVVHKEAMDALLNKSDPY